MTAPAPFLLDAIRAHARLRPIAPALLNASGAAFSYHALISAIDALAAQVQTAGVAGPDTVALALPDGPDLALAVLAIGSCAACAPLHASWSSAELEAAFDAVRPRALVVPAGGATAAVDVARRRRIAILELHPCVPGTTPVLGGTGPLSHTWAGAISPDAAMLVLQTAGTSGPPRFVRLTHRNVSAASRAIAATLELTITDRALSVMPLAHIHGLSAVFASLASGGSAICAPAFSASAFFDWLAAVVPTWYTAAPTIHLAVLAEARARGVDGGSLRFIRSASAPLPRELAEALERVLTVPVVEAYGMTEASPQIASNRRPPHARKPGSVGRPAGPEVVVLSEDGSVAPVGARGEIAIRGENVCAPGWLHTGDLGHVDADGDLFITGRKSDVINRGGEKIAPLEIETVLLEHPDVVEAIAFAVPHQTLGESVAAAVVLRSGADVSDVALRGFVGARLSPFKVPHPIVIAPALPVGATGKHQRRLLAEHFGLADRSAGADHAPALTPLEATVAGILGDVLGRDALDRHTDFFLAGGDSLSATQAILRLREDCAVDLPPDTLFVRPTVAELAAFVASSAGRRQAPIPARRPGAVGPLSAGQQRLWLLDQLDPGSPAYNMQLALRLSGPLDTAALEQALSTVRERHESLRTTFPVVDGQPVQQVASPGPMRLPMIDLQAVPPASREHELARVASDAACTPFNLARGPLFQSLLVRMGGDHHALLLTMHHVVSDGWSMRVLQRELRVLYVAAVAGEPSPLPPLRLQFADVAAWERARERESSSVEAQRTYWRNTLAGLRTNLALPTDRPRPAAATVRGARLDTTLPSPIVDGLRALGRRHDATLFMTTLAAFQALLMRYAGQDDLTVGTPIAGRRHADTEPLIGFFANTLVMRADLSGEPSFAEHLRRTRHAALGAFANQDLPFEQVVEALQPPRQPGRTPLFQVMFAFQNLPDAPADLGPGLVATPLAVDATTAKFDLTLYVNEDASALRLGWQYNADLFDAATIGGMAASFEALVARIVDDAACPVSALSLGPPAAEPAPLPHGDAATHLPLFVERFRAQAARTPDAVAVSDDQRTLTYAELDRGAARMALALRKGGRGPGAMVGVCVTRSVASAVALVGIWRAGGVYVPFDPAYPAARLTRMAADARVDLLVTDATARASWPDATTPAIDVEDALAPGDPGPSTDASPIAPSAPAYVIYTSGSAGSPKGVAISHGNVTHYLDALQDRLEIDASDRCLHTASFAFSSSVRQLLLPLAAGAAVVVASHDEIRDPRTLLDVVRRSRVTVIDIVPSYWRELNRVLASGAAEERATLLDNDLRLLLSASEPLLMDVPRTWRGFGHRARLVNMYGQTETTGIVSVHEISGTGAAAAAHAPVGRPLRGVRLSIRDGAGRPVPDGVVGELVVSGPTVGLGYRNRPEENAVRFALDPASGERVYATGDRARRRADGTVVLLGRSDRQVKCRGFRIEPGEVEAALAAHPLVHDSAVVMQSDDAGHERLVAYVVTHGRAGTDTADTVDTRPASIRAFLESQLPHYMVPSLVHVVDALPLTPTGKVDRTALVPAAATRQPSERHEEPRQPAEQLLTGLWRRLLRRPGIGVDDNFFDLGGDSLLGLQMIDEANRAGLHLTPAQLFQFQTVAELARASRRGNAAPPPSPTAVDAAPASRRIAGVVRVSIDSARAFGIEALTRAGLDAAAAAAMTEVQIEASLRGQPTHNLGAIPRYARRVRTGVINRAPQMRVEHETPTSALLDADNAAGQLAALHAMDLAVEKAARSGIGIVGVRHSNHFGAAGHYVWRAATQGVIGLCTTNSALWLAPTGGLTPLFGTNPLGVGVPSARHYPIVLDVSMSVTAKGKVALELAEGRPLAPGWIFDQSGRTSIDPADLIAGLGVPIGGHKGYGLALTMEILAGVLTGAGFGADHRREHLKRPDVRADFGHCFIAIDPGLFMTPREFAARVDRLIDDIKQARRMDGVDELLLPGEAEMRAREQNLVRGLPLSASVRRTLDAYRTEAGLVASLMTVEVLSDV